MLNHLDIKRNQFQRRFRHISPLEPWLVAGHSLESASRTQTILDARGSFSGMSRRHLVTSSITPSSGPKLSSRTSADHCIGLRSNKKLQLLSSGSSSSGVGSLSTKGSLAATGSFFSSLSSFVASSAASDKFSVVSVPAPALCSCTKGVLSDLFAPMSLIL